MLARFWQACKRVGRDENHTTVHVIYGSVSIEHGLISDFDECERASAGYFKKWIESDRKCCRLGIEEYLEGAPGEFSCAQREANNSNVVLFDVC